MNSKKKLNVVNTIYNVRNGKEAVDLNNMEESGKKIGENEEVAFRAEELQNVIKYNACQCWNLDEMFKFLKSGRNRQQY